MALDRNIARQNVINRLPPAGGKIELDDLGERSLAGEAIYSIVAELRQLGMVDYRELEGPRTYTEIRTTERLAPHQFCLVRGADTISGDFALAIHHFNPETCVIAVAASGFLIISDAEHGAAVMYKPERWMRM